MKQKEKKQFGFFKKVKELVSNMVQKAKETVREFFSQTFKKQEPDKLEQVRNKVEEIRREMEENTLEVFDETEEAPENIKNLDFWKQWHSWGDEYANKFWNAWDMMSELDPNFSDNFSPSDELVQDIMEHYFDTHEDVNPIELLDIIREDYKEITQTRQDIYEGSVANASKYFK